MASAGTIVIKGIGPILKKLKTLSPRVAKKVVRGAMRKGLKPIKKAIEQNAPVKTGLLKRNVKIRSGKRSRTMLKMTVGIGTKDWQGKTWYGAAQEFGTSKMPGKGFIRKAFESKSGEAARIITTELLAGIMKEVAKSA